MLESYLTTLRDKAALAKFIKKTMRRHGRTLEIITDSLRSYSAAQKALNTKSRQAGFGELRPAGDQLPFD